MNNKEMFGWVFAGISNGTIAMVSTGTLDYVLSTATLIVGLLSGLISIAYTLYKWYRKSVSQDSEGGKKITPDEMAEVVDIAKVGIETIKEVVNNGNRNKRD